MLTKRAACVSVFVYASVSHSVFLTFSTTPPLCLAFHLPSSLSARTGFWTGKFLNKERLRNAATGAWFKPTDFGVGKRVAINTFVFDCYEVDSYTAQFLAAATREESGAWV